MRAFIALDLPEQVKHAIAKDISFFDTLSEFESTPIENLHITLAFLENIDEKDIGSLNAAIGTAISKYSPFEIELGEIGAFSNGKRSVIWRGLSDCSIVNSLAKDLRSGLSEAGVEYDSKDFIAHITLGRCREDISNRLSFPAIGKGSAKSISLYHSDLTGSRPVYICLSRFDLGAIENFNATHIN